MHRTAKDENREDEGQEVNIITHSLPCEEVVVKILTEGVNTVGAVAHLF
ncbi:MAG: hypothetical protein ACK55Z_15985 [bacterium]